MHTITLIDNDPNIHHMLLRALRERFPDAIIHACTDGEEGWQLIQTHPPDLVIFDLCLPSLDGLDLFLRLKNSSPSANIILTSGNRMVLQDLERKFSAESPLQVVPKPFLADQIIERATTAIYGEPLSTLRDVSLASVLQFLSLEGKNCWLDVHTPAARGTCHFYQGDIVHATCGREQGIEALHAMMRLPAPTFTVFASTETPLRRRNVFARFNELLLLCCTVFDEGIQVA